MEIKEDDYEKTYGREEPNIEADNKDIKRKEPARKRREYPEEDYDDDEYEDFISEKPKKGLFRKKRSQPYEKNKMKVRGNKFNTIVCHFLEETSRGDMLKINQKNLRLRRDEKNNTSYVKVQRGTRVHLQTNEMLLRADGTKETFILRTGAGSFKALSLQYLSENYFKEHDNDDIVEFVSEEKDHALYMRSMNINERQVFMDTAKKIVENAEQGWEKIAPWAALVVISIILVGGMYMMSNNLSKGQTAIANKNLQASRFVYDGLQNLSTNLLNGIQTIKSNPQSAKASG